MKRFILITAVLALMFSVTAQAGPDISVWIGRMSGDELLISGTKVFGAGAGFSFARYFGFEVVFDYIPDSELPFDLEQFEELLDIDVRVDLYALSGNFVVQYPIEGIATPYFTIGYGVVGAHASTDLDISEPEVWGATTAMNWGFGAKVFLTSYLAVRGEMRWYNLDISVDNLGDLVEGIENPTLNRLAIGATFVF